MSKKANGAAAAKSIQAQSDAELDATSANSNKTDAAPGATVHEGDKVPAHSNFKFKVTKQVAVQLFKLVPNVQRFFLCDAAVYVGKKIDDKKEAALLMPVTDLETGEQGLIIVGAVLKGLLEESYTGNGYVGKKFALTVRKRADKAYNTYDFAEIETDV